jgi:hypothetical protein
MGQMPLAMGIAAVRKIFQVLFVDFEDKLQQFVRV